MASIKSDESDDGDSIPKCYGVLPLCLRTDPTPHHHCPMSVKCSYVSLDEVTMQEHVKTCMVKPATIPEESYLICSKVQAFCVSGQDRVKKCPGQKHYHCAGYPECMHVSSRLNSLKLHIFTCEMLAKRLDLYPACCELACRHQYDGTRFHFHCDNCDWTSTILEEVQSHRALCYVTKQNLEAEEEEEKEEEENSPVIIALVSNDNSVLINLQPCSKRTCMDKIDIKMDKEHYHCPACEFCAAEQEDVLQHFNHLHYNFTESQPVFLECYALDVSCCAEKTVERNKTFMSPVRHYHCPNCKEFSDCSLAVVKHHYITCAQVELPGMGFATQSRKRFSVNNEIEIYNTGEIATEEEIIQPLKKLRENDISPLEHKSEGDDMSGQGEVEVFDHRIIECSKEWIGCAMNRGVINPTHYHCPYCTWSNSIRVNVEAHMSGCLEKMSIRYNYDENLNNHLLENTDYDSPVEYPIIDERSREFINIIPCSKRINGCSRIGVKMMCAKSNRIHWHCPICGISAGRMNIERHFETCSSKIAQTTEKTKLERIINNDLHRNLMNPTQMRHSDSEDSDIEYDTTFMSPESFTSVIRCYKKLPSCGVDELPGRPLHYHCGVCGKSDLNKKRLEQHQVVSCLRNRAKALRINLDPNESKFKHVANVIVCKQREASCNTADSKRITHYHCSVCSYVSYRKDRAENHVQKSHLNKKADSNFLNDSYTSPPKNSGYTSYNTPTTAVNRMPINEPCEEFMEKCEQDILLCKDGRKVDPRRKAHWHCTKCDFVDYKRYRLKCHIYKTHFDPDEIDHAWKEIEGMEENLTSDEEEDEVAGVYSCINDSGTCSKNYGKKERARYNKKHWHCSLCNFWAAKKHKTFVHYVKCLRNRKRGSGAPLGRGVKDPTETSHLQGIPGQGISKQDQVQLVLQRGALLTGNSNRSPLVFCTNNVYQCTFPLNTRIDDKGLDRHWHCPICDTVGFIEADGLRHYDHCSNFVEFHVKSQDAETCIELDVLQCSKDIRECNPTRKREEKRVVHFHCPLCPFVDYRKPKVESHITDICCAKASSTHIFYCSLDVERCSAGARDTREHYFGHWHCSMCTFLDYNKKKVAHHYRDCYIVNQKYGNRFGYNNDYAVMGGEMDGQIHYPDIGKMSDKELTLLKIIPCSKRLKGCETGTMNLEEQPLHYHCPVCTRSDYLHKMIRHFPRCLKLLDKRRKSAAGTKKSITPDSTKRKRSVHANSVSRLNQKKLRTESLACQVIDKTNGIFVVRGSAVGLGFPVHVIFKKTHPKEFHCEAGCEMHDRQLCKHLTAVEKFVRDHDVFKEETDTDFIDVNADFPELSSVEMFHSLTDEEKCDVYTIHNYCLDNNTPVIRPYQTFKWSDGEETACTFYSVCSAVFKGYYTRSGRVITTYNKKTHKYLCKCFYKECVHTNITKIYRESQAAAAVAAATANVVAEVTATSTTSHSVEDTNNTSLNSSNENFLDNLYEEDPKRFLRISL